MAFVIRAALVVGAIYMISPIRPDGTPGRTQDIAAEAARLAAAKAMETCAAHADTCARLAAGGAAVAAAVAPQPVPIPHAAQPPARKDPTK